MQENQKKNVKIGLGIGVGCFILFFSCVAFSMLATVIGLGSLKNSEPLQLAVATAEADPRVEAQLGVPLETGFMPTGSLSTQGEFGEANLSISVEGPTGSGRVHTEARRSPPEGWRLIWLAVEIDATGETITVIEGIDEP